MSFIYFLSYTQKIEFPVKDFFNKSEQILNFSRICSRLLKKFYDVGHIKIDFTTKY